MLVVFVHGWSAAACPMSHLVMLAPANYGSALAQLGKSRISRLKFWFEGVEPGAGVLDWLEHGSPESWALNESWIREPGSTIGRRGLFPFVVTGQSIDRSLYDNLNTYTGENGSDGVVRVAAANMGAGYVRLEQQGPQAVRNRPGHFAAPKLNLAEHVVAPRTALRIVRGKSHSGKDMGIMRSVSAGVGRRKDQETVNTILACFQIDTKPQYDRLCLRFEGETASVQDDEKIETEERFLRSDKVFIHDRMSMVVFRVRDREGYAVEDFDLLLTADNDDPNLLPHGFALDRQRNSRHRGTLTYYFNYDAMQGGPPLEHDGEVVRRKHRGTDRLGVRIQPRPTDGFVHYLPCAMPASTQAMQTFLVPNRTTLVDIVLWRVVRDGVFAMDRGTRPVDFRKQRAGRPIG